MRACILRAVATPSPDERVTVWHRVVVFHLLTALVFAMASWRHYRDVTGWGPVPLGALELGALLWLLAMPSLLLAAPPLLLAAALVWRGRPRAAQVTFLVGWSLVHAWLVVDLGAQRTFGNHVHHYIPYVLDTLRADSDAGFAGFGGDPGPLLLMGFALLFGVALLGWIAWRLSGWWARRRDGRPRRLAWTVAVLVLGVVGVVPAQAFFERTPILRRTHQALTVDLSVTRRLAARLGDLTAAEPSVRIVSLRVNPRGPDPGKEEVTLHNFAPAPMVLDGWWLADGGGARLPLAGVLDPRRSRRITIPAGSIELRNDGDSVALHSAGGDRVHEVAYSEAQAVGGTVINFRDEEDFDAFSRRLNSQLDPVYRRIQASWRGDHPPDPDARVDRPPAELPDVVVIVLESLRHEVFAPDYMPRLDRWAAGGLRLRRHYSASNISHFGLYGLLYARLPLFYGRDLDDEVRPQLTASLGASGYETLFIASARFAGWRRMEEYLSERNFDEVLAPTADWRSTQQWVSDDRWMFAELRTRLAKRTQRPRLMVAFATSTHYPFEFPPEFDRHTPSGQEVSYENWMQLDRAQLENRYRNACLFMEDEVMRLIESVDPARTVVVVTGDHGESLGEDGVLSHGSKPSEIQLRVPFAMVGPGVPAREIRTATSHADLVPTLLHVLAGRTVPLRHTAGRDLLAAGPLADRVLLAPRQQLPPFELLLVEGHERLLFKARVDRPFIETFGFLDPRGDMDLERPVPPAPEDADRFVEAMRATLERM